MTKLALSLYKNKKMHDITGRFIINSNNTLDDFLALLIKVFFLLYFSHTNTKVSLNLANIL